MKLECLKLDLYIKLEFQKSGIFLLILQTMVCCYKVEFYQLSCWLYSVPNLLVFQYSVTLYLGGILVRVVSEIV